MDNDALKGFGGRLILARERCGMTQEAVGEKLAVSYQSVSHWESGKNLPSLDKAAALAQVLHVSCDWLILGEEKDSMLASASNRLSNRLFSEERMYTYIKAYATMNGLNQTLRVLPYARRMHEGQVWQGKEQIPFIYHPLTIARHAMALGLVDDNLISTALLHDICEKCAVKCEDLMVNDETREAVRLLTQDWNPDRETEMDRQRYYEDILQNYIAVLVKLLERCNNISGMTNGFENAKAANYIKGTQKWIYPLMEQARTLYPGYTNQIFLIRYHIISVVEAVKRQLKK